ncbi:hypothetical protein [Brevibacterium sp. W7.2]|uniref:hypothetical protein n=1 Tax=Brevibacterium sp. W7.2 TaxID=2823518 RepID=UPI001BAA628A|nr:hypothetical protein [Brevibacterium sp. W7.2]
MRFRQLSRYSKPRRPGDQTSGGRGKLLRATADLTRIELLIRETLQNSWDAREEDWYPAYGVRLDRLDKSKRVLLLDHVFTDLPESLEQIRASLSSPDVHVVEIYDRGTTGLDGPFRASEEAVDGMPNNFNSFVFDIGTTSDSEVSGGTFGFGKTATFEVSKAHSVVYWSRCRGLDGELEYRLIASSLHDDYAEGGKRYTGAHWWGVATNDDVVPLRGHQAEELGNALFQKSFGEDETGTSILIIDPEISFTGDSDGPLNERTPVRTDEQGDELIQQVSDALAYNAWPKTISADGVHPPMIFELFRNDQSQEVAAKIRSSWSRWADALIQVRRHQEQQSEETMPERPAGVIREVTEPISLRPRSLNATREEVFGDRTDTVVGHLHLVSSIGETGPQVNSVPKNKLCMMRSGAELVVRYEEFADSEDDGLQWHGVFKPTPQCDRHFSATEPSTHDSWNPRAAEKEVSTYVVEKALQQVRLKTRKFLSDSGTEQRDGERSVRMVALALRSFMPLGEGPDEELVGGTGPSGRRRSSKRRADPGAFLTVMSAEPLEQGNGQQMSIMPESKAGRTTISATAMVYAKTSEGRMLLNDSEISVSWFPHGGPPVSGNRCALEAGRPVRLELRTLVPMALEVDLNAEEA